MSTAMSVGMASVVKLASTLCCRVLVASRTMILLWLSQAKYSRVPWVLKAPPLILPGQMGTRFLAKRFTTCFTLCVAQFTGRHK